MSYHSHKSFSYIEITALFGLLAVVVILLLMPIIRPLSVHVAHVGSYWRGHSEMNYDAVLYTTVSASPVGTIVLYSSPGSIGKTVYTPTGEFVGTVSSAISQNIFSADLFSAPDRQISVRIPIAGTNTVVPATGRGHGVIMISIPSQADVAIGSTVTTVNGTPVGTVKSIVSNKQEPNQRIFVGLEKSLETVSGFVLR